jgi:phosphoheptose isomerase
MAVAVVDYDSDTTVQSGNIFHSSCQLECVLVNYTTSANKTAFVMGIKFCRKHNLIIIGLLVHEIY